MVSISSMFTHVSVAYERRMNPMNIIARKHACFCESTDFSSKNIMEKVKLPLRVHMRAHGGVDAWLCKYACIYIYIYTNAYYWLILHTHAWICVNCSAQMYTHDHTRMCMGISICGQVLSPAAYTFEPCPESDSVNPDRERLHCQRHGKDPSIQSFERPLRFLGKTCRGYIVILCWLGPAINHWPLLTII